MTHFSLQDPDTFSTDMGTLVHKVLTEKFVLLSTQFYVDALMGGQCGLHVVPVDLRTVRYSLVFPRGSSLAQPLSQVSVKFSVVSVLSMHCIKTQRKRGGVDREGEGRMRNWKKDRGMGRELKRWREKGGGGGDRDRQTDRQRQRQTDRGRQTGGQIGSQIQLWWQSVTNDLKQRRKLPKFQLPGSGRSCTQPE